MQLAHTQPAPAAEPHDPRISWSSLKLLPWRVWIPLAAAVLLTLALVGVGGEALRGAWSRALLWVLTALILGLLATLTRLFMREAERRTRSLQLAEEQARQMEKRVDERTQELSALCTHLQALSEKEKAELARNLHDELGGLLTAAKMDLSWLQARIETPGLSGRLAQLSGVLDEAMDLKRRVVEDLRPSLLEHFGLATAVRAHVEAACARAGLARELVLPEEDVGGMPRDTAIALFRIIQEGLTNTIRHSGAGKVRLTLTVDAQSLALELCDDGCGFTPQARHASHGILGMQQRARSLGGELQLASAPGAGTTLRVRVPARSR